MLGMIEYLENDVLPQDEKLAQKFTIEKQHFVLVDKFCTVLMTRE